MHTVRGFMKRHRRRTGERRVEAWLAQRGACMAQDDLVVANAAGAAVRADINAQIQALGTLMSGTSAPATTYAYMYWADTTNNVLKQRNAANSAWIVREPLVETFVIDRSSNTILGVADRGRNFRATAGFTQTLTAAATLADGWYAAYRVESGATIVFDPNSSENIDGATTKTVVGPSSGMIFCNGSAFFTIGFVAPGVDFSALTEDTAPDMTNDFLLTSDTSASGVAKKVGPYRLRASQATVNAGTDDTSFVTPAKLAAATTIVKLGSPTASTSGTSIDFTGIPAGTKEITISFVGVSTNGTSPTIIQIGDSGGIETSGYQSGAMVASTLATSTAGFELVTSDVAAQTMDGSVTLTLVDSSTFTWAAKGNIYQTAVGVHLSAGSKSLSAELDRVRITTIGGTDAHDAGKINVAYK